MCGIAGIIYFEKQIKRRFTDHQKVLELLKHRGPDRQNFLTYDQAQFYHSRLVILDPSSESDQPFEVPERGEVLVFNGEIFNYRDLQKPANKSKGDVAVLFHLMSNEGKLSLPKINGFFAFAFYNRFTQKLLLARDRMGVKPLYYYLDQEKFAFASELKPLMELIGPQELNQNQIYSYFRLNYCAGNETIFKNVFKLAPGHYLEINEKNVVIKNWYEVERIQSKDNLEEILTDAVKLRLHADVPVGCFLSGGIDSAIISAVAKKLQPNIETFSIGFKDHPFLDESEQAEQLANHIQSKHHSFQLKEDDFLNCLPDFLDGIDEPFADSSAFNFYILSKYSRNFVKVALSGDGADELFKGYQKHRALMLSNNGMNRMLVKSIAPISLLSGSSRESFLHNQIRKIKKFNQLIDLEESDKLSFLASISSDDDCRRLMQLHFSDSYFKSLFQVIPAYKNFELNDTFDLQTVLPDDMLVKADRFSMRHGLEIRNPFIDYRLVLLALNLPSKQKINSFEQKIILKKTFGHLLPSATINRKKRGFEVPLRSWLIGALKEESQRNWLNRSRIEDEKLLNYEYILELSNKLHSKNSGESAAQIWAIIVFQNWLKQFKAYIKPNA